ncbi:indolepyruvate oxidoreductase subunit beta [Desulfosporosinus burensis]
MSKIINVLLVGVGGQGTILASKILTHVALAEGYQVKMSEIHGMAQRGGSVVTQVRMGEYVYSPVIEPGEVDFLIAFEQLEAYRWSHYLKKDGVLIVNTQKIVPLPVLIGAATYPETILVDLKDRVERFIELDGLKLASDAGNAKATNVVLMGVLSQYMDFPEDAWQSALVEKIPAKLLELNNKAFASGVALVK